MKKTHLIDLVRQLPKKALLLIVQCYRYAISPMMGNHCRFYPSCSHYTFEAISRYGAIKGSYLGVRRLLRCHPWSTGGIDPVPECSHSRHRHSSLHES
ncbi:membrane protein insertion efficiency factor YidD [Hahella ganghwensis]|uniref:membrane protein insertion efficiency factor YidD n=1 Tax=Hahella ganghwensis TaxID=286420 RepID=UPI000A0565C6|nr:membrane protein insertion efficiency factor YidD [Hahella ganghwensis]